MTEWKISSLKEVFATAQDSTISYLDEVKNIYVDAIIHRDILIHGSYVVAILFIVIAFFVLACFTNNSLKKGKLFFRAFGLWALEFFMVCSCIFCIVPHLVNMKQCAWQVMKDI